MIILMGHTMPYIYAAILITFLSSQAIAQRVEFEVAKSEQEIDSGHDRHTTQGRLSFNTGPGWDHFELKFTGFWGKEKSRIGYGDFTYRGLGFYGELVNVTAIAGYQYIPTKFVVDEFDYSISRGIIGGLINFHGIDGSVQLSYESYNGQTSHSSQIDSFPISVSVAPYKKMQIYAHLQSAFDLELKVGALRDLELSYSIPNFNVVSRIQQINYYMFGMQIPLNKVKLLIRGYTYGDADENILYYLGSPVSFDILKGVSVGLSVSN